MVLIRKDVDFPTFAMLTNRGKNGRIHLKVDIMDDKAAGG